MPGRSTYVDFRLYNGVSGGLNDVANNFEIGYMEVIPEPSSMSLLLLAGAGRLWYFRRDKRAI